MKQLILEDTEDYRGVSLSIEERLIQVMGRLLGYDAAAEKYHPLVEECFLCVDRLATDGRRRSFLLHITDKT